MARKARQGSRPKKKQAATRSQPVARVQPTVAPAEPDDQPSIASAMPPTPTVIEADLANEVTRVQRVATSRTVRPYQHRRGRPVAAARPTTTTTFVLPREQEYGFIRSDLRRLLITAAVLAVMMVALLIILEP